MLIYQDIFTGDELCSDSFPTKLVDDVILEFRGKYVVRKEGDLKLEGANPSAEEMDEGTDEAVERGIDIILNHRLQNMSAVYGDKKAFTQWCKEYMKKLVEKMKELGKSEEEINNFKTKMQEWVSSLLKKERFQNLEFYSSDGENAADGQVAILEYRDENGEEVPTLMLIKPGLEEIKC